METNKKPTIIVLHKATPVMSFVEDAVTFGGFIALLWFNHRYLSGNGWLDLLFIVGWIFTVASMQSRRYHKFTNAADAIKYLNVVKKIEADNDSPF